MDLAKLDGIINTFGTDFINKMKADIQANNSLATGTLLNSIGYNFNVDAEKIVIQFFSEDYGKYVDAGRQAGTYPNVGKLEQWLAVKGIPLKASYPIAMNIKKLGIKAKPFLYNDFENRKHEFLIALIAAYGSRVKIEVTDMLKTLPKQFP